MFTLMSLYLMAIGQQVYPPWEPGWIEGVFLGFAAAYDVLFLYGVFRRR